MSRLNRPLKTAVGYALGLIIGLGITSIAYQLDYWWTGDGQLSPWPFLGLGVSAGMLFVLHRRGVRPATPAVTSTLAAMTGLMLILAWSADRIDTVEAAYGSAMRADLRFVVAAQDQVYADSQHFIASLPPQLQLHSLSVNLVIRRTSNSWTASVQSRRSPRTCVVFVGATPLRPAVREREPACTRGVPFAGSRFAILLLGTVATAFLPWILRPDVRPTPAA